MWREILFCWTHRCSFITFFWRFLGWLPSEEMVLHVLDISSVDHLGLSQRWKNQQVKKYKLEKLESESGQKKTVCPISCMASEMVERFFCLLDCCMAWINFTAHYLSWSLTNGKTVLIWPSVGCRKWYLVLQADCANDDGPTEGSTRLLTHPWGPYLWASPPSQKVNRHFQDTSVSDSFWFIFQSLQDVNVSDPAWLVEPWDPVDGGKHDDWHNQGSYDHLAGDFFAKDVYQWHYQLSFFPDTFSSVETGQHYGSELVFEGKNVNLILH